MNITQGNELFSVPIFEHTQTLIRVLNASEGQKNAEEHGSLIIDILVGTVLCIGGFGDGNTKQTIGLVEWFKWYSTCLARKRP
jgi:hypothetical protein